MQSTERDPRVDEVIDGRYRILERLSAGSMGVVYRGERVPIGKQVAIKFLHASFAQDPEFLRRFERETRVMSRLTHPNCVSVLDFGVADAPFLVMDFVHGQTLRHLIDDEEFSLERALSVTRQLLSGLAHAHAQGIVHRDIKPANIMITDEIGTGDHVRILDFGLATLRGAVSSSLTQSCVVVGTPMYMSPEQSFGGAVDARTDVYAVGVILFELVTGDRPFVAADTMDLLGMHRGAPVPRLANVAPQVAYRDALQGIIDRALAKDPAERFASAVEFAGAIDELLAAMGRVTLGGVTDPDTGKRARTPLPHRSPSQSLGGRPGDDRTIADQPRRGGARRVLVMVVALALIGGAVWAGKGILRKRSGNPPAPSAPSAVATTSDSPPAKGAKPPKKGRTGSASGKTDSSAAKPAAATGSAAAGGAATGAITPGGTVAAGGATAAGALPDAGLPGTDAGAAAALPSGLPDTTAAVAGADAGTTPAIAPPTGAAATGAPEIPTVDPAAPPGADSAEIDEENDSDLVALGDDPAGTDVPVEAAGAPATAADAEALEAAAPPTPVRSVEEAVALIKKGERERAISALLGLWKKSKKSAYIPFLLGNLYFDKQWWSVALEHYQVAIAKNRAYRSNMTLIRNVIRALASTKTRGKAIYFLRHHIGAPAIRHLRVAAKYDKSPTVRRVAGQLAKRMAAPKRRRRR